MTTTTKSIVYKTVGELEIALDIHIPANAESVPVLLWFHGGGLLQGHRKNIAPHMLESISKYKHALISADYRLAPQVGVQSIYSDVKDCVDFIRSPNGLARHLGGEMGETTVDTTRLAVSGSSAGGYLALLAGLYVEPKPQVLLPIYPITDPLGTFFTTSQPQPPFVGPLTADGLADLDKKVQPFLDRKAPAVANNTRDSSREKVYSHMLAHADLAELLHFDVKSDPQHNIYNDEWRIAKRIATRKLPPAYIVHGTIDSAVGVEQADEIVGVMVGEGLEVKYKRLNGKDHLFDVFEPETKLEALYEFMHSHL